MLSLYVNMLGYIYTHTHTCIYVYRYMYYTDIILILHIYITGCARGLAGLGLSVPLAGLGSLELTAASDKSTKRLKPNKHDK